MMINVGIIKEAQGLCSVNTEEETVTFTNSLDDLGASLSGYLLGLKAAGIMSPEYERLDFLGNMLRYFSLRFMDLILRLQFMDWFWSTSREDKERGDLFFYAYAPLFIKDFHIDVSGVMDAIAPIAILATQDLKDKDKIKLPSFSDILPESKRSYRKNLPEDLRKIIDETQRWWRKVKEIRDIVTHRDHLRLVFGPATAGKLFKVFDIEHKAQILDEVLLYKPGNNVVNFEKYASWLLAELLVLFDRLGRCVANHINFSVHPMSLRQTNLIFIVRSWDQIIRELEG